MHSALKQSLPHSIQKDTLACTYGRRIPTLVDERRLVYSSITEPLHRGNHSPFSHPRQEFHFVLDVQFAVSPSKKRGQYGVVCGFLSNGIDVRNLATICTLQVISKGGLKSRLCKWTRRNGLFAEQDVNNYDGLGRVLQKIMKDYYFTSVTM